MIASAKQLIEDFETHGWERFQKMRRQRDELMPTRKSIIRSKARARQGRGVSQPHKQDDGRNQR